MAHPTRLGPRQQDVADRTRALLATLSLETRSNGPALRAALAGKSLLAVDAPVDVGGLGFTLAEALAAAEVWGEELTRAQSSALVEAVPARVLGVRDHTETLYKACVQGQAAAALLDVTSAGVKLDRRPGGASRLTADLAAMVTPQDARSLVFAFEERTDWVGLAVVAPHHAALRIEPLAGLPLMVAQGVMDVEVQDSDLIQDAPLEVVRALAAEELMRAARAVGEARAALLRVHGSGRVAPALTPLMEDRVLLARTALYAAAERLLDGGPHTLLGEDGRFGGAGAAMEARAVSRQALLDCALITGGVMDALGEAGLEDPEAIGRVMAAQLDCALASPATTDKGVWYRLGDGRMGALFALRQRPSGSTRPAPAATSESSTPTAAAAETTERKSSVPGRVPSGRVATNALDVGPLPFVPEDVRPLQLATRQLVGEHPDALGVTVERDGTLPDGALDILRTRGLFSVAAPPDGGPGAGLCGVLTVLEELGRTHQAFSALVSTATGTPTLALHRDSSPLLRQAHLVPLAAGESHAALAEAPVAATRDGSGYVLRGRAHVVSHPGVDVVFVPVSRDNHIEALAVVPLRDTRRKPSGGALKDAAVRLGLDLDEVRVPVQDLLRVDDAEGLYRQLRDMERLMWGARLVGMGTHSLEVWRAALTGRGDSTRTAHVRSVGQWWSRLAQVRALLWTTAMMAVQGEPVTDQATALARSAVDVCTQIVERSVTGVGVEALMSSARLREHLRQVRIIRVLLTGLTAR